MASPVYDAATVARLLGIQYSEEELATFRAPLPAIDGFLTFFDPGWSILQLREKVKDKKIFYPRSWYDCEEFAQKQEPPRYRQLRLAAVEGSSGKTFAEQRALLPDTEEVALARVVVMAMALHFLATGERLFPNHWVRCGDVDSDGHRVCVGDFACDGLEVSGRWGDGRVFGLGLSSTRKS